MAVMTQAQWNKLQASLPAEDRSSYTEYLASQGLSGSTANLDKAAAANAANAATTIAALQDLGVGGQPAADARAALNKLTSGQTLTAAEKQVLNISSEPTPAPFTQPMTIAGINPPPATTESDPLKNKSVKPSAPAGYHYTWIGGTTTGSWQLYKDAPLPGGITPQPGGTTPPPGSTTPPPGSTTPPPGTNVALDVNPTLAITKAYMVNMGYPKDLIDSSTEFLKSLIVDGMTPTNAVDILTTAKSYTTKAGQTLNSPFYEAYGIYNEGLSTPKSASELFNAVEGYKATKIKYNLSDKFTETSVIKNLIKNNWTVADFDNAANTARLMAITSDPYQVEAMRKLGFINSSQDLTDFYIDPTIGKEKMQQNITTAAYGAEMLRRIKPENLLTFNQEFIKRAGAAAAAQGLSADQATAAAAKGMQNIADALAPTYGLSGIYERGANLSASQIQSELEQEQLTGMPSERRKRLAQQNIGAFSAAPGTSRYSTSQAGAAGLI